MTKSELASVVKNCVAVLLIPLSLIVVLLSQVVHQLGIYLDGNNEMFTALAAAVGIVLFLSAVVYLAAGLRTYFPLVDLPT
jgi:hypothetical protein